MCHRLSSSARCLAATWAAAVEVLHRAAAADAEMRAARRGDARARRWIAIGARDFVRRLALDGSDGSRRSPGNAPSTKMALPSTRATPRPSWSSDPIRTTTAAASRRAAGEGAAADTGKMRAERMARPRARRSGAPGFPATTAAARAGVVDLRRRRCWSRECESSPSTRPWCGVAVGTDPRWHARDEHAGQTHSERRAADGDAALADAGWPLASLDGLAFGAGPGSFTGIRIGCGVAQGLALGADLRSCRCPRWRRSRSKSTSAAAPAYSRVSTRGCARSTSPRTRAIRRRMAARSSAPAVLPPARSTPRRGSPPPAGRRRQRLCRLSRARDAARSRGGRSPRRGRPRGHRRAGTAAARGRRGGAGGRSAAALRPPPRRADDPSARPVPAVDAAIATATSPRGPVAELRGGRWRRGSRLRRGARGADPRGAVDDRQLPRRARGGLLGVASASAKAGSSSTAC